MSTSSHLLVRGNVLTFAGRQYRCALGRGGIAQKLQEGDGITPQGIWALRECWYRADRLPAPQTDLPLRIIHPDDGWCDAPGHPDYNRHVKLPFVASHEILWREDHTYDLIIPLGYNDQPVQPGKGSAIFMHIAKPDYSHTEGCIALAMPDLLALLPHLGPDSRMEIRAE